MKKTYFLLVGFIACSLQIAFAQKNSSSDAFETQQKIYHQAMKRYDLQTATVAMYNMIALKPTQLELNDSLALLYFGQERYPQSYLLGEEILKTNPEKTGIRELVASSKQNLGMLKESLAEYEKLYKDTKSLFFLYQAATLQYQLKRFGECVASLEQILSSPETTKQKVTIRTQSGAQEVPMNAAALNIRGICAMELNQPDAAKSNFIKALEIYPEFALAKGNLESLDKHDNSQAAPASPLNTGPNPPR
ncbi:MAG: hypothetical protein IPP77_07025 [Bacteroidetes bacterium]|nr:hypothetical protein [Bacteroidota bacterium]